MLMHKNKFVAQAYNALAAAAGQALEYGRLEDAQALIEVMKSVRDVPVAFHVTDGLTDSEIATVKSQGKIYAIKELRDRTKMGLKEAKDLVEAFMDKHGVGLNRDALNNLPRYEDTIRGG